MKVAVGAGALAKGYVQINSGQLRYLFLLGCINEMTKVKQGILPLLFLTLCSLTLQGQSYPVHYYPVDADSSLPVTLALKNKFASQAEATAYLNGILPLLQEKGYLAASVDSVQVDSNAAMLWVYFGAPYRFTRIHTRAADASILTTIRWPGGSMDVQKLNAYRQAILDRLEEEGHPFAATYLDSIRIQDEKVEARLRIEKGPAYYIDSLRVVGNLKVDHEFLQRYLLLPPRSLYNRSRLQAVSKKLAELSFAIVDRPPDLSLLGNGAVLNLYLSQKKSSQVNALIGFLPSTDLYLKRRLMLAVDAHVMLKNALGKGETLALLWQQLQKESPRLNLLYDQPYVFHSPFGLQFNFDMFRQDTSFVNINLRLGSSYNINERQSASVFFISRQSIVNGINTAAVLQSRRLPAEVDFSSLDLGAGYNFNNTDYRPNPRKGMAFDVTGTAGTRKIKRNNALLELKDAADPGFNFSSLYDTVKQNAYQLRVVGTVEQYLPLGRQTTLKMSAAGGLYQSPGYYRNELFRIGGYRLLRGFNDESQYVNQYLVGTLEFRYLLGLNSAFFAFVDGGGGRHVLEETRYHQYLGTGLGLSFETKAGVVQLAWALGRRDDTPLDVKQSKIHIGFAGYF